MESSEFVDALAPTAYDGGGLLLTNPWVWITALLIGILILWLGWHFGAGRARDELAEDRARVIDAIYDRINDRARIAAAAPRNKVVSAAHDLHEEIRKLLGPVVDLTPFGRRATALARALAGSPTSRNHDDPQPHADEASAAHGAGGHGPGDGHGHGGEPHPATALSTPAPASQVNISISAPATTGHGGHGEAHPPRDAVRDAVMDVCDYWSRSTMKAELAAAQKALLRMPAPKAKVSGGHH